MHTRPGITARRRKELRIAYLTLIPVFLYHFVLILLPSLSTFAGSFTNWNGLGTRDPVGFANYIELFRDPVFFNAFGNNLRWMAVFLVFPVILGLVLGYTLSKVSKARIVFRAIYFLPYVISAAIAGKIFAAFYNPYFGINIAFEALNLNFLVRDWLAPKNSLISVAIVDMWHWWGFLLVIFMSALQQIDPTASTKYVLFVGERGADLSMVFTAGIITMLPIVAAFIEGMTSGSIK